MPKPADNLLYDGCRDFALGIDSGIAPQSLPSNQCAFAVNTTFRGDYATARPPFRRLLLTSAIDTLLQQAFSSGLFQAGASYKPDAGPETLMCAIAGRQFQLSPSADPAIASPGIEITIPGDPNPANISQNWMWQSERWLITQDGLSKPIFFDGVSARRSQTTVGVVGQTAADFDVPPIGGVVNVTLTAPYTGLLNSVLNLNEVDVNGNVRKVAHYMVTQVGGNVDQYQLVLKNLTDTPGTIYSNGNSLIIQPSNLGSVATVTALAGAKYRITLNAPIPGYVVPAMVLLIGSTSWVVVSTAPGSLTIQAQVAGTAAPLAGQRVTIQNYNAPNITAGVLASSFTAPAVGASNNAFLTAQFTYPAGQILFLGTGQYQVVSSTVNPPAANIAITVQNLNDSVDLDPATNLPLKVLTGSQFFNLPELPPGRMGTYGMGRNWQSGIDGITFLAGDLVGGSSGSPLFDNRDAVLKVTENSYLAGGGVFRVPGAGEIITAMMFTINLDTSLGQGPLQVFTNKNVFTCQAPVDRLQWQNLTNPILTEALKGAGAASQSGTINSNADSLFRSPDGQLRSLLRARLDFNRWGNTPISFEVLRITETENDDLMNFCPAKEFDNRWLVGACPVQGIHGVYWQSLIVMNFDPISTLEQKSQSIYEGMWTGLNILEIVRFSSVNRCFAFCVNPNTNLLEVYEFLPTGSDHFDNGITPIEWSLESPMLFQNLKGKSVFDLLKLEDGEMYVSDIIGRVDFKVQYRPDFDSCWYDWHSWFVCARQGTDPTASNPQFRKRMGFGQPTFDGSCVVSTDQPPLYGTMFQVRIFVRGQCVINGFRCAASLQPIPRFAEPICDLDGVL